MNRILAGLFSSLIYTAVLYGAVSARAILPNWADLDAALRERTQADEELDAGHMLVALQAETPTVLTNTITLIEMAVQSRRPFVAIAGLAALRRVDENIAFRVSLQHLWQATNVAFPLLLPFWECITNPVSPSVFRSAMSCIAVSEPSDKGGAMILLAQIRPALLVDWLASTDSEASTATLQSLTVDRLLNVTNLLTGDQVKMVGHRLQRLRGCPGIPRAIFLLHAEVGTNELVSLLKTVVEDVEVDAVLKRSLFRKYAGSIANAFDIESLNIPEKEKQRYKAWLEGKGK